MGAERTRGEVIVLDASAAIDRLLQTPEDYKSSSGYSPKMNHSTALTSWISKVAQVLRRLSRQGIVTSRRAGEAIEDLSVVRITRYPHTPSLEQIWQLRHYLSAYDASYLVLAERLNAVLVTRDARLASASGAVCIEVFE